MNELYTYVYTKAIKKYAFHDFPEIRLAPPGAVLRVLDAVGPIIPGTLHGARPKGIAARAAERVPVNHRKAQMFLHGLAFDDFIGIVVLEGKRILGSWPFKSNGFKFGNAVFIGVLVCIDWSQSLVSC